MRKAAADEGLGFPRGQEESRAPVTPVTAFAAWPEVSLGARWGTVLYVRRDAAALDGWP